MKTLIVRVGAMGDVLHAIPAVVELRARRPDWQIDWVVDPRWRPLLVSDDGVGPIVDRVHLADTRLWSRSPFSLPTARSIQALRRDLQAARYDMAIDMQGTLRSAVIARLSGAPFRAGFHEPREPQARWFYTVSHRVVTPHVIDQGVELLLSQADRQGFRLPLPMQPLPLPPEPWADNWAAGEASAGKLCLLAAGAGWGAKQWPRTHFAGLARELRARGFDVAVTSPRKDNETALRVVAESQGAARLVVANVSGLVALTRRAALVVGGDSGPTHLAAALGIPLVALFGPTDPARNGPRSPGPVRILRDPTSITSYKHIATADPGLARISVAEVLQAALEVTAHPLSVL